MKKELKRIEQEIKKELEKEKQLSKEYLETLQRVQAEFENYIKRIEKEKEEFKKYARHDLILKILDIADDFERALIAEEGVREIKAIGEKFDAYIHDIVGKVEGEKDNVIVEEVRKGYMLKDKVLRSRIVKVSKVKEARENE